jgi:hypothetical protein
MKTKLCLIAALLLAGCASPEKQTSLTPDQARDIAIGLANQQSEALFHCQPFKDGPPARWTGHHWVWTTRQGVSHADMDATVELNAAGKARQVEVRLFTSIDNLSRSF